MLSLLARLHNILDDNSNRELNGEYMTFWPTSVAKYAFERERKKIKFAPQINPIRAISSSSLAP